MSSIVLGKSDAYINIGAAKAWRDHLLNHTFSAWMKTTCQSPACLVSLTNDDREVFSVDINITPHPSRDATLVSHTYQSVPPTRFIQSAGARWQRAPIPKTLRPVRLGGAAHGALMGQLAGGLRICVQDMYGQRIVAESPLPILADGRWHFIQVTVDGNEVIVYVDSNHTSVVYVHRDASLHPIPSEGMNERVVYPSQDLFGARFLPREHRVTDNYCGLLADLVVEIGHRKGHKLHWWVTDFSVGTIVWDRGSGAQQHPQGLHLNLCNCTWETEDFPATSLLLNGYEGRTATIPELTQLVLESIVCPPQSQQQQTFPGGANSLLLSPSIGVPLTPQFLTSTPTSLSIAPAPASTTRVTSPPTAALESTHDDALLPVSQTMNREYFERVKKEEGRKAVSFSLWLCTTDRDPSIVFTAPFKNPMHLILNLDCKPSIALVNGTEAFVAQCDATDGKWHHIRWVIDPKTGASLFVDGALAAWQHVPLDIDEGGHIHARSEHANSGDSPAVSRSSTFPSPTAATKPTDMQDALRRRSISTSMINLHSERKSLCEVSAGVDVAAPGVHEEATSSAWKRARSRNSITYAMEEGHDGVLLGATRDEVSPAVRSPGEAAGDGASTPVPVVFALEEGQLFGPVVQELEEADEHVTHLIAAGKNVVEAFQAQGTDEQAVRSAELISNHFLFLSIRKRREIIQFVTDLVRNNNATGNHTNDVDISTSCFTFGAYFQGEVRDVSIRLGPFAFSWRFDIGCGRSVAPAIFVGNVDPMMNSASLMRPNAAGMQFANTPMGSEFDRIPGCIMDLTGRTTLFPKTVLPYSSPVIDEGTYLDLGSVRIPLEPQSTGIDADFYVRLRKGGYGHVCVISGTMIFELQRNRINVFLLSTLSPSLRSSTFLHNPNVDPTILDDTVTPRVVCCHQESATFEDCQWHHVRLVVPTLHSVEGVAIAIDEIPMELTAMLVMDQFPHRGLLVGDEVSSSATSVPRSSPKASSSRRGTILQRHTTSHTMTSQPKPSSNADSGASTPDIFSSNFLTGAEQRKRPGSGSLLSPSFNIQLDETPTTSNRVGKAVKTKNTIRDIGTKLRWLLTGPPDPTCVAAAHPQAAYDVRLCAVACGGNGFTGSMAQLRVITNGVEYRWPLTDAARTPLSRLPPVDDTALASHPSMKASIEKTGTETVAVPQTASAMRCDVRGDEHTHWRTTSLPTRALHFDGKSSFVSSINLRSNFHMTNLKKFAVSMWIKASAVDATVSLASGCIFSVHDVTKPTAESHCGIFSHTSLNTFTSPYTRMFAARKTTFLLMDSCGRALCLETAFDIYDGLWHKLQWVVYDAYVNESHVFVDDIAVPTRVVCGDQPKDFSCRRPVVNLGARNEGDNEVNDYFVGEMTNFRFSRNAGDDIVSWSMTEGEGDVLNDEFQRIAGCVWAPEWVFTPFPPLTPVLHDESVLEFSPVSDLEKTLNNQPLWFSFSFKSNSSAPGIVWSILSADRTVLGSFVVNEGGDHERRTSEPGTHILRIRRVVQKQVTDVRPNTTTSTLGRRGSLTSMGDFNSRATTPLASSACADLGETLSPLDTGFGSPQTPSRGVDSDMATSYSKTPARQRRRIARRSDLKQLLLAQQREETPADRSLEFSMGPASILRPNSNSRFGPIDISRQATVVEERAYQLTYKDLCNGKWHKVTLVLPSDSRSQTENAKVLVDELDTDATHLYTTNIREVPDGVMQDIARMPETNASTTDRTPLEALRDELSWASVVLGKPSSVSTPSLHCCIRNFAVLANNGHQELLFVPLASTTQMLVTNIRRDVAANALQWVLSVPPTSSLALSNGSYIKVPPLAALNLRHFEVTFKLRAVTTAPSCILEFGTVDKGYFCIMLNQDAFGDDVPNSIRFCLCDSQQRELHASCLLSEDEYGTGRPTKLKPIEDDRWHDITLRVVDASRNQVVIDIDGVRPQIRYANCGSPSDFCPLTEGGTIGTLLMDLDPTYSLIGSIKQFMMHNLINGSEAAMSPDMELQREIVVCYDATSGFASIVTDRSGHHNHALAVKPNWKTDIQTAWPPMDIPSKAVDIFPGCNLSVSRWSNNPQDVIERNPYNEEVVMDEFPEEGWTSGAKGPQWLTIDLGAMHTVFAIEIDMMRASTSRHEIYASRSNLSKSSVFHGLNGAGTSAVPQATLIESIFLRPTSPKTMRVKLLHPLYGVRWLRVVTVESVIPVGYGGVRVIAVRGDYTAVRKNSVSETLGVPLSTFAARSQADPTLPMFPDTFVACREVPPGVVTRQTHMAAVKKGRIGVCWGGDEAADVEPELEIAVEGGFGSFLVGAGRKARRSSHIAADGGGDAASAARRDTRSQSLQNTERVRMEQFRLQRKSSEQRTLELRAMFYTQDVERIGEISLASFMDVFKRVDVTGLLSQEQILSYLRDAGVLGATVNFDQFVEVIAHLETW